MTLLTLSPTHHEGMASEVTYIVENIQKIEPWSFQAFSKTDLSITRITFVNGTIEYIYMPYDVIIFQLKNSSVKI